MVYCLHLSHFIIPESKASLMARWTWGLHSWWAAHIKWQLWCVWTDGAARLNSDVCFPATADVEMILGRPRSKSIFLSTVWCFFITKHHFIFSANRCPQFSASLLIIIKCHFMRPQLSLWLVSCTTSAWPATCCFTQQVRTGWCVIRLIYCPGLTSLSVPCDWAGLMSQE